MRRDTDSPDERFAAQVREHGERHLVRRLDARESVEGTVRHITITFRDFGLPVAVSPPPASVTWTPPA
jgi:hypothetical protein